MEDAVIDPRELLERLHADRRSLVWQPLGPSPQLTHWRQRPMSDEVALEYIHRSWALPDQPDASIAGGGLKGRFRRVLARIVFRILGPYLRSERDLLAHMVRMHDAVARRCDELAAVVADRQVADAENDTRLAAWLQVHADDAAQSQAEPV